MAVAAMAEEVMMTAEVTIAAEVTHTQARRGLWDGRRVSKTARGVAPAAPGVACYAAVVAVVVAVLTKVGSSRPCALCAHETACGRRRRLKAASMAEGW